MLQDSSIIKIRQDKGMYFLDSGYEILLKKYMELLTKEEGRYFLSAFPFSAYYSVY